MKYLEGFKEYFDKNYHASIFETVMVSNNPWTFHLHGHNTTSASVSQNQTYEVELTDGNQVSQTIPKTQIKLIYPTDSHQKVQKSIKYDSKVKKMNLEPIVTARLRYHIKNKSLYVLMKEKQVVFFTLLEGEIIRGLITEFTRYDITVNLKGGVPVILLRHSVYDLRDKKGRCYLKSFQQTHRDWKKSSLYVTIDDKQ